jgi:uncharacterized protein (DUF58 family)
MKNFIDPKTLSRVKDLPLVAKTLAQGFMHGVHHSVQRGVGIEFSQYRVYEPGDELSKVDWKLFARSDRYFVREAERESDVNIWLVIDSSASMAQKSVGNSTKSHLSKFEYGKFLAATMGYLGQSQGDNVGLVGLSTENKHFLPALSGQRHYQKLLINLAQINSGGHVPSLKHIRSQLHSMQKSGIIFVISDFYQYDDKNENDIVNIVSNLVNERTEVIAVQLQSNDEVEFQFKGALKIEDLETKQQLLLSSHQVKEQYLQARGEFNQTLNEILSNKRVKHWSVNIDQPMDEVLHEFLNVRNRMNR